MDTEATEDEITLGETIFASRCNLAARLEYLARGAATLFGRRAWHTATVKVMQSLHWHPEREAVLVLGVPREGKRKADVSARFSGQDELAIKRVST